MSCRCSTSTSGASSSSGASSFSSSSSATSASAPVLWDGRQVAAEGMAGPESAGVMTRPSVAKICSASSATAAIAAARSSLNWRRSARRRAVTSSDVSSASRRLEFQDIASEAVKENIRFPPLARRFVCRASQLGSLRERSPFPKNPRRHKINECSGFATQTERVVGSKTPSQYGFSTRASDRPSRPKTEPMRLGGGSTKRSGRGCA